MAKVGASIEGAGMLRDIGLRFSSPVGWILLINMFTTTDVHGQDELSRIESTLGAVERELRTFQVSWSFERVARVPDSKVKELLGVRLGSPSFFGRHSGRNARHDGKLYGWTRDHFGRRENGRRVAGVSELESATDGKKYYRGSGSDGKIGGFPMLRIAFAEDVRREDPSMKIGNNIYFRHAGFRLPNELREIADGIEPRSMVLYIYRNQFGILDAISDGQSHDGVACKTVSIRNASDELNVFYLDATKSYAMRQWDIFHANGDLVQRVQNSSFVKLGAGVLWLPRSIEVVHYRKLHDTNPPGKVPLYSDVFTVESMSGSAPSNEQFAPTYPVGTWITDHTYAAGKVTYQIPADESMLDDVIRGAHEARSTSHLRRKLILCSSIVLVGLIVVVVWKRSKQGE